MPETREWSNERWQLDQAVLDAEMLPRSVEQIARLESMRDSWDQMAADARLGAALRAALASLNPEPLIICADGRVQGHDWRDPLVTNATRLLAALLAGAPRTETP